METILFMPDTHIPYEDERAVALTLEVAAYLQVDHYVIQGDFMDACPLSTFEKTLDKRDLKYELDCTNEWLDLIRDAVPKARIVYVEGNHEYRWTREILRKMPELFGITTLPRELRLQERGISWVPYKQDTRLGKVYATHDTGRAGKHAVLQTLELDYQHNCTIGHIHRIDYHIRGNVTGEKHVGASFGWLGDFKQLDYIHRVKAAREWAHGFGLGYKLPNGTVHIVPVPIINYKCVVAGELFEG